MTLAQPDRLWLLIVVALVAVTVVVRHRRRIARQRQMASPAVWNRLMGGTPGTGLWRLLLWCLAAALVVVALARPQWGEIPEEVSIRTRDLVVALDVSDSMRCPDVKPNRLGRALEIIRRALPALEGNRVGVVVFAGEAYPLIPLTTDLKAAASFLDGVQAGMVGRPGSNLEAATSAALELLPPEGEGRVVVMVSDGENLQGSPESAADKLKDAGVNLLAVVVGTERGGPIPTTDANGAIHYKKNKDGQPVVTRADTRTFKRMADEVGGMVLVDGGPQSDRALVAAVEKLRTREVETEQKPHRVERFPLFLMAAALSLMLAFALSPWRRRAAVVLVLTLVWIAPASAQTTSADASADRPPAAPAAKTPATAPLVKPPWWQRLIPGGSRRLARSGVAAWNDGDKTKAAEKFAQAAQLAPRDPRRLFDYGTALAAEGQNESAAGVLAAAEAAGVDGAAYNAGTAALKGGQAKAAVEALRRALLSDPSSPDVKRNYELALKMLDQQQQQQDKQDQQKDKDEKDEEKEKDQRDEEQKEQKDQPEPTPTPRPEGGSQPTPTPGPQPNQGPAPTPTPNPKDGLYDALDRAEAAAREAMQTPVPTTTKVEKDW